MRLDGTTTGRLWGPWRIVRYVPLPIAPHDFGPANWISGVSGAGVTVVVGRDDICKHCPHAQKMRLRRLPLWLRPGMNITVQQWRVFLKKVRKVHRKRKVD